MVCSHRIYFETFHLGFQSSCNHHYLACILILFFLHCSFKEEAVVDHRDIILQAVKQRYLDENMYCVSRVEMVSYAELNSLLGFSEETTCTKQMHFYFSNIIQSPSSGHNNKSTSR